VTGCLQIHVDLFGGAGMQRKITDFCAFTVDLRMHHTAPLLQVAGHQPA
jgi:hypothetical protein